jgi:hypothetical protein
MMDIDALHKHVIMLDEHCLIRNYDKVSVRIHQILGHIELMNNFHFFLLSGDKGKSDNAMHRMVTYLIGMKYDFVSTLNTIQIGTNVIRFAVLGVNSKELVGLSNYLVFDAL